MASVPCLVMRLGWSCPPNKEERGGCSGSELQFHDKQGNDWVLQGLAWTLQEA